MKPFTAFYRKLFSWQISWDTSVECIIDLVDISFGIKVSFRAIRNVDDKIGDTENNSVNNIDINIVIIIAS